MPTQSFDALTEASATRSVDTKFEELLNSVDFYIGSTTHACNVTNGNIISQRTRDMITPEFIQAIKNEIGTLSEDEIKKIESSEIYGLAINTNYTHKLTRVAMATTTSMEAKEVAVAKAKTELTRELLKEFQSDRLPWSFSAKVKQLVAEIKEERTKSNTQAQDKSKTKTPRV